MKSINLPIPLPLTLSETPSKTPYPSLTESSKKSANDTSAFNFVALDAPQDLPKDLFEM